MIKEAYEKGVIDGLLACGFTKKAIDDTLENGNSEKKDSTLLKVLKWSLAPGGAIGAPAYLGYNLVKNKKEKGK